MEGEVKIICGVPHKHIRCIECGGLAWSQTVKGGTNCGYRCNECCGISKPASDMSYRWNDRKVLLDAEV